MKNKNKIVIIIGIVAIILVIGVSYAWLKTTVYGQKEYIIKAGNLDLVLDETSNGLMIENELPVEDRVGLASDGATFQVRNNSTSDVCYEIYLDNAELTEGEVRVEDKFVKYSLDKGSKIGSANVLASAGTNPNRLIDEGEITAGQTINYKLRLWFNAEEDGDYAGQVFKGKLRIEATQCQLPKMRSYADVVQSASYSEQVDYHADLYREKITSIITKTDVTIPETAIEVSNGEGNYWDVSETQDESVIAYIEDDGTGNGTYKVTIGATGGVRVNSDARYLFYKFTKVTTIDLSSLDTSGVTRMDYMFHHCDILTDLNLNNFDTSNVMNMSGMFHYCTSLTYLDISNFDTSKVTNMLGMFYYCSSLTSLDLSNFDTSKVTNMCCMFENCRSLTNLDLSGFDTSNVKDMSHMFYDCRSLISLDLSNFDTSKVTTMSGMFQYDSNLQMIKVGSLWTTATATTTDMFTGCGIDHVTVV